MEKRELNTILVIVCGIINIVNYFTQMSNLIPFASVIAIVCFYLSELKSS